MEVIPAVDIRAGRCVRLVQGDYDRETVFDEDPVRAAVRWVEAGARRLHVVDLDGARHGGSPNEGVVRRMLAAVTVPIQVGGGIRTLEAVDRWLAAGVERVIVGTAAVEEPSFAEAVAQRHPGRVAVSVDVAGGRIVVRGWQERTPTAAAAFLRRMWQSGVRHLLYTDVDRDGTMAHPDVDALQHLLEGLPELRDKSGTAALTYAGGVASVDDIRALLRLQIEGVILGRALYEGRIELPEALATAANV